MGNKEIKLKRINRNKYCIDCKKIVEVKMKGKVGHCPDCDYPLYTIDSSKKDRKEYGKK